MLTAVEYSALRDQCLAWAREAVTDEVRETYVTLARIWADRAADKNKIPQLPAQG